jgi:hypothetical protein
MISSSAKLADSLVNQLGRHLKVRSDLVHLIEVTLLIGVVWPCSDVLAEVAKWNEEFGCERIGAALSARMTGASGAAAAPYSIEHHVRERMSNHEALRRGRQASSVQDDDALRCFTYRLVNAVRQVAAGNECVREAGVDDLSRGERRVGLV